MIVAMILAAGESARMGHPKALLNYRGATFLEGILSAAYAAGLERRVVVLGHHADKVLQALEFESDATMVVRSEKLEAGPIGSIRAGIRLLSNHPVEAVVVWSVDRPHVSVTTIEALVGGFRESHLPVVVPAYQGRRGHPVLFGREVFQELLDAPDAEGARAVVRADRARVLAVPVDDPAVLEDLDTPEQYEALLRKQDRLGEG